MALKRSFSHVEVECDEENYKRVCDELETVRNSILKRFEQCFYLGNTFDGTYAGDLVFFRVNDDNSKLWAKMFIEHLEPDDHEYFSDFSTVDKLLDDSSNGILNGIMIMLFANIGNCLSSMLPVWRSVHSCQTPTGKFTIL